jgi:CMP-N-acetylneuraminic acid synthetase
LPVICRGDLQGNKKKKNDMIAIVPMKADSERVHNKNRRLFNGSPLYFWIFQTLSSIDQISKIILDTDSESMAEEVLQHFPYVHVSIRPFELRGDTISMNAILAHIVIPYDKDTPFLQTHATNPCLTTNSIESAISLYNVRSKQGFDSLFSVNRIQTRLWSEDAKGINHNPDELLRTQDLPPVFEENSNIYIFTPRSFFKTSSRIGQNPVLYEMTPTESWDIDTEVDFRIAELLHQQRRLNND